MANVTTNTNDPTWYDDLMDSEKGVISGMSNGMFFGIIIGGILGVVAIGGLIYFCKRKKELEAQVREQEEEKARKNNQVAPTGDIYEEMQSEIEKHEAQKKKLSTYLSFLLAKDGQGLMNVNNKRAAARKARNNNGWF